MTRIQIEECIMTCGRCYHSQEIAAGPADRIVCNICGHVIAEALR